MEDELMLAEIEKIFGKPTKMCLFSEDEESYRVFRQTIIDSPTYSYDKLIYPFDDNVKVTLMAKKYHLGILHNLSSVY